MLRGTSLNQHDISILNHIVLALGHDLSSRLDSSLIAKLPKDGVIVDNGLDEGLLKVSVNDTSRSGGLDALADSPLANLIRTGGEETGQVQCLAHGRDDLGQTGLGAKLLALLLGGGVIAHEGQTLLELSRDGQDWGSGGVFLDPLKQLGEVFVLLANVILLAQVDKVHDGLGSEQKQGVDDLDLKPC